MMTSAKNGFSEAKVTNSSMPGKGYTHTKHRFQTEFDNDKNKYFVKQCEAM